MDDLAGIILPMLLSGADVMDILKAISGAGYGASNDGLQAMLRTQMNRAIRMNPLRPSQATLDAGASMFIDRIGINPLSGLGQGMTKLVGSMYGFAPDIIGSLIGVPNPGSFFRQIANGASGIGLASGYGMTDMFNPYSVMQAHDRAMSIARQFYDVGTNGGNGYDTSFAHGLNFSEMGAVAQRLMSSRIPYLDENGRQLDIGDAGDADKFRDNIKKLGSKFNEAASMLAKITGSVDEALKLMDRMGGGNFLSGTAEQAASVANRARNLAASVRITAAAAGVNPTEVYRNMSIMQGSIASDMGIDPTIAMASGYFGDLANPAYAGTMGYYRWAAMNPTASIQEKQQAMLGAQYRTNAYFSSSGARMAAIVAGNRNMFSDEDIERVRTAYSMGRPNDVQQLVRDRIGNAKFAEAMNNDAMIQAYRMYGNKDVLNSIDIAGMNGNLYEAQVAGAGVDLSLTMSGIDERMARELGSGGNGYADRREAATAALRRMAVRMPNGLTDEAAAGMSLEQIRGWLVNRPGVDARDVDRREKIAMIESQLGRISAMTMSDEEEAAARRRFLSEISAPGSKANEGEQRELAKMVGEGRLNAAFERYYDRNVFNERDISNARVRIMGGRLTRRQSGDLSMMLREQSEAYRIGFTPEEWRRADEAYANDAVLKNMGRLLGAMSGEKFKTASTDREALQVFSGEVAELAREGVVATDGDDERLSNAFSKSASMIVRDIFGGRVGNLSETDENGKPNATYDGMVSKVAGLMMSGINERGLSVGAAFADAMSTISEDEQIASAIGYAKEGKYKDSNGNAYGKGEGMLANGQVEAWIRDARGGRIDKLTRDRLASGATSVIQRITAGHVQKAAQILQGLFMNGDAATDRDVTSQFSDVFVKLRDAGMVSGGQDVGEDLSSSYANGVARFISSAMGEAPDGIDVSEIAYQSVKDFFGEQGGDWRKAIVGRLRSAAGENGIGDAEKNALIGAAESIWRLGDVRRSVIENTLGAAGASPAILQAANASSQRRELGKFGAAAASNANDALKVYAASQQRLGFSADTGISRNVADMVAAMDIADANRKQNALHNAIQVGGGTFAQEAIEQSKANVARLRDALSSAGITAETASVALFGAEDTQAAKESKEKAKKLLESAIDTGIKGGKLDGLDQGSAIATLRSLNSSQFGKDIGGFDLLFGNDAKKNLEKVSGNEFSQSWARMTKEANRQDSVSYDILSLVSSFAAGAAKFFANPAVSIKDGVEGG